jgi:SIR2-like protein
MFTLNQDLWPERHLFNEHASFSFPPDLPGVRRNSNQRLFTADIGNYSENFLMHPIEEPSIRGELRDRFNVIKLHGSFNWRAADAQMQLVMGTKKDKQIQESPLLSWYFDIFQKVLSVGDVRLLIVGYGFGDEHVNRVIANGIENHNLRVFVWDIVSDLRSRILAAPYGSTIWSGLLSTLTRSMIEVFPSDQSETYEYRRLQETFFRS